MEEITFRLMTEEDLDSVAALERQCFSRPWQRADFADALHKEHYLYYVALQGQTHIATAGLILSMDTADLVNVAVTPEFRRKGVGSALIKHLLKAGEEAGVRHFTLEVRVGNTAAIKTYETLGFLCEGRRKNFYRDPVEDALIYWLHSDMA